MTRNPFQTQELLKSASNYPVAKGDLPGHPFHGNQYTSGMGGTFHPANLKKGTVADLKRAIKVGTKLTLLRETAGVTTWGNTGKKTFPGRPVGTTYTVSKIRSGGFIGTGEDGKEIHFDFPKASEMTYTPENSTVTFHERPATISVVDSAHPELDGTHKMPTSPENDRVYKISN